jgi:uroporphyrinogen decarboxylase
MSGSDQMTPKEKMIVALNGGQPEGLVPHFELEFFLTMEAFGRIHPLHRHFHQWDQMSVAERDLHRRDVADLHIAIYQRFGLSGTLYRSPVGWGIEDTLRSLEYFRELSGDDYFTSIHGDATYAIPSGENMMDFVARMADDPDGMKDEADRKVDTALARAAEIKTWGLLDGFCLCSDYCFNDAPFLSPDMFAEFIAPYLKRLVAGYRELGFYVIKHTDGNIMPILDQLVDAVPHALHSIDPQGGVDIAEVKRRFGGRICLIGNVNCASLQTGTIEEVESSVRYALKEGMPGGGYIFSTSNCIYTGMPLERYELMQEIWKRDGVYI